MLTKQNGAKTCIPLRKSWGSSIASYKYWSLIPQCLVLVWLLAFVCISHLKSVPNILANPRQFANLCLPQCRPVTNLMALKAILANSDECYSGNRACRVYEIALRNTNLTCRFPELQTLGMCKRSCHKLMDIVRGRTYTLTGLKDLKKLRSLTLRDLAGPRAGLDLSNLPTCKHVSAPRPHLVISPTSASYCCIWNIMISHGQMFILCF